MIIMDGLARQVIEQGLGDPVVVVALAIGAVLAAFKIRHVYSTKAPGMYEGSTLIISEP